MTRRAIHQLVIGAAPDDAITSMAMRLRTALRSRGESELYGLHIHPALHGDVLHAPTLAPGTPDDLLVYHASFGEPRVTELLESTRRRLVVCYHNITPAAFFERDYPDFAAGLQWGRDELQLIRPRVVAAFADSRFNADELVAMGYADVEVLAAGLDPYRLARRADSNVAIPELLAATEGTDYVVAVAQQLPHKRLDVIIQAVHLLQSVHRRDLGLVIVGADRFPLYGEALRTLSRRLRVRSLWFAGSVDDDMLAGIMRGARVFVSASEHEGLGVPPLEAMTFDVPVVARSIAAVPEVLGDAGVLLPPDAGPELFAEPIALLCDDEPLRAVLTDRGRRRVRSVASSDPTPRLVAALEELVA